MAGDAWLSIGLGGVLGLVYGVASFLTNQRAFRHRDPRFMKVFLGGMIIRLLVALGLITLVLKMIPTSGILFITSFMFIFILGTVVEVFQLHRTRER